MNGAETAKFFSHGEVALIGHDSKTREAQLRVCLPCCLFLAVSPSILGFGVVDEFQVHQPLAVWIPKLTPDRFLPEFVDQVPLISEKSNSAVIQTSERALQNFQELTQLMRFPDDLISTLPLGVYVEFGYRCSVDNIAKILLSVSQTPHHGIAEFRYALAEVLTTALNDIDRMKPVR